MTLTKSLVAGVLVACWAMPHIAAAGLTPTTTTLTIAGKVARNQTVTLTAKITGYHTIFDTTQTICNLFQPNTITFYDGNTVVGTAFATQLNSTDIRIAAGPASGPCVNNTVIESGATTTVTATYKIPASANSVNLRAAFTVGDDPNTKPSQSSTYTTKLASAQAAITDLLFND